MVPTVFRFSMFIFKQKITSGWNSWNHFYCGINEKLNQQTADAIEASGLAAAGYEYGNFT